MKYFAERDFTPFIEARFQNKPKTLGYYKNGIKSLNNYAALASCALDGITAERIAGFIAKRRADGLQVSSVNRELEVLRRMFKLAIEWGKVEKALPKVEMLRGENHRDRVLSGEEEARYLESQKASAKVSVQRCAGNNPLNPWICLCCATLLRYWPAHVPFGKTENARRTIPFTQRALAILKMRRAVANGPWVFPAGTESGRIEKSTLKKQHPKACRLAKVMQFPLYTFRHTCLTRWAEFMDPFTLAYLAGHSDFSTTKRYVHPQAHTVRAAIERARVAQGGHSSGHTSQTDVANQMR